MTRRRACTHSHTHNFARDSHFDAVDSKVVWNEIKEIKKYREAIKKGIPYFDVSRQALDGIPNDNVGGTFMHSYITCIHLFHAYLYTCNTLQ